MTRPVPPTVTVGVDGSPEAQAALHWAADDAALRGARLLVVSAYDNALDGILAGTAAGADLDRQSQCEKLLDDAVAGAAIPSGVRVDRLARHGEAGAVLTDAATGSVLLAVGARGRGGFPRLQLGSVARKCAHQARRPVVVVRGGAAPGPVVCGVDGSPHSDDALHFAADEAKLRGVPLSAVHAVHWDLAGRDLLRPSDVQLRDWGTELLQNSLRRAFGDRPPVPVHLHVRFGHPGEVLEALSHDATLLVVGARGRGTISALLLGSVSAHLLDHATCPIALTGPASL